MNREYLDETKLYLNTEERLSDAWELLSYAHMLFSRVYAFKHLEEFSKSFVDNPPDVYWEVLSYEKLIDEIKICTAFENYNKAVLLINGYLVHVIDAVKNSQLAKQQKLNPVLISEFLVSNKFIQNDKFSEFFLEGFQNFNTLSFSKTLSPQYQMVIGLEERFLGYLKSLNEKRNRLHFYKNYPGAFKVETFLDNLKYAKSYGLELIRFEIDKVSRLQNENEG